ncbi:hypothetical protein Hanom_Chr06g00530211 [Helianthus anomalus]
MFWPLNIICFFCRSNIDYLKLYIRLHRLSTRKKTLFLFLSKLQVLSFMFTPNCRRCPLAQKLTSSVLNVPKSCTLCPLALTQLDFLVKYGHVPCT